MAKLAVIARPITDTSPAHLLLVGDNGETLEKYLLDQGKPLTISITEPEKKYCVGWYDISTHSNYVCEDARIVDPKYESCFDCRKKTGFNPAFYNTADISDVQAKYNNTPHTVYIAYLGDGLAKAGIMSNSRGLERLYEQGALLYCIAGNHPNATSAHNSEAKLIAKGLRNSVTKRQKQKILTKPIDVHSEQKTFSEILKTLDITDSPIVSNLDHFFFGSYLGLGIELIGQHPVSGLIRGIIGRYLVLENNGQLYGFWLDELNGYRIEIDTKVIPIESAPQQASLFG